MHHLKSAVIRFYPLAAFTILVVGALAAILIATHALSSSSLSTYADIITKISATTLAGLWALNRYYVYRTDAPQLRVDAVIDSAAAETFGVTARAGLLTYRLDLVNTGRTLLSGYAQRLTVTAVEISGDDLVEHVLHTWPNEGHHPVPDIEPGSWSAVNAAIPLPDGTAAVRLLLDVVKAGSAGWTWHRTWILESGRGKG